MDTKIKEALKIAQVKQRAIESHRKTAPKFLSPQKKEEKSSKGSIAPGVKAFLDTFEKEQKPKDFHSSKSASVGSNSSSSTTSSSSSVRTHDDFDPKSLFKSDRRVARLPDAAIPNMLALSNMRKELKRKREEEKLAAIREKEEKERLERQRQREKEKADAAKKEALQRALKNLGVYKPEVDGASQSQVKPTTSSSSSSTHSCSDAKKRKLNDGTSRPSSTTASSSKPGSFKIPRKSTPAGPPPPSFGDLLKVAEKNANKPVSVEAAREILSVDLFAPSKFPVVKKDPVAPLKSSDFGRLKNSKHSVSKLASSESKGVVSISKLASSLDKGSNESKTKLPSLTCSSATSKSISSTTSQKSTSIVPKCAGASNKDVAFKKPLPLRNNVASQQSCKAPATMAKRPLQNVTSKNSDNSRPPSISSGQHSSRPQKKNNQQLEELLALERQAQTMGNETLRNEILKLISKHKCPDDSSKFRSNSIVKGSGNSDVGQKPGVVSRPNGSSENGSSKSKPVQSGWERAMSHLQQKKPVNIKKRPSSNNRRIESDEDDEEEEYDSEMDDFIDDGDAEIDYSTEIRRIFKYDRRKFEDEDDDIDNMESNFAQIEKEEAFSAKVGRQEDLEDMMMEQEELRRKKEKMKTMKSS